MAKDRFLLILVVSALVAAGCNWGSGPDPIVPSSTSTTPSTAPTDDADGVPSPREFGQLASLSGFGEVLLFGGGQFFGGALSEDHWLFDVSTESWSVLGDAPKARIGHVMEFVDSLGMAVMYGGGDRQHQLRCLQSSCPTGLLDDMWMFDPTGGQWQFQQLLQGSPGPRSGAAAAYDSQSDRLVLFGGIGEWDGTDRRRRGTLLGDLWTYDPSTTEWAVLETTGPVPDPRAFAQMVYHQASDRIVMWGGFTGELATTDPIVWSLDVDTGVWDPIETDPTASPHARWFHAMEYDPITERIVVFGGEWYQDRTPTVGQDVWHYDHTTHQWQQVTDLIGPVARPNATAIGDGSLLGLIGEWTALYDVAADTWTWWDADGDPP